MSQQKAYKTCEQFVLSVYKTFETQPLKLQIFINLFNHNKKQNNKHKESQSKLTELVQDYPDLVDQLNKILPDDYKIAKSKMALAASQEEEEQPMDINKIFAELQARRPDKVQHIIELIQGIKNNKNKKNNEGLRDKLAKILEDEPNLFTMFMKYLRPFFEESGPNNGHLEPEASREESLSVEAPMELEEADDLNIEPGRTRGGRGGRRQGRRGGQGRRTVVRKPEVENGSPTVTPTVSLPVTVRNELNLFENLRTSLNKSNYNQLMKIIYLYTECVIGANEVYTMVKPLFKGNDNYANLFQEMIFAREKTRRKNTTLFKPLSDIDFAKMNCQRNGSYSKLPEHFPHMKSPIHPKNPCCDTVLNKTWLSVPHGSEVGNFTITAKNTYEENLLKCEDERYEFDSSIYQFTTTIKWLDNLEEMDSKEAIHELVDKILRRKIAQKVCGNNDEILEGFKKNPLKFAKKLSEKILNKLNEIKETKVTIAKKKWHETSVENFHRSLDHRSFYFKQYEKKFTYHKNFLSDATARHQDINILGNPERMIKYMGVLNTFEGISNGVYCHHPPLDNIPAKHFNPANRRYGTTLPIYCLVFPNKQINQEICDMLNLKIQHFHANFTEKEKITKYLKVFLQEIMGFTYGEGESYNIVFDEGKLLAIVARIQAKIFDKTFSFNAVKIEEAEKNNQEETIYAAIQEGKKHMELETTEELEPKTDKNAKPSETANGVSQRMEEEVSPKKRRKGEKGEKRETKPPSEEEERVGFKEMDYSMKNARNIDEQDMYDPIAKEDEIVFYGTQHLYYLIRFYYSLYERFLKVHEISSEFETNPKAKLLSDEAKESLVKERYDIFKWVLAHLVRGDIENEKYEDLLRCVFGNKAYLMFFVDRIIHMFIITIQKLMNDDTSVKTLNFFTETELPTKNAESSKGKTVTKKSKNWPEYIYLAQINQLTLENMSCLQSTTFFRFVLDPKESIMTISMYDSAYKGWNEKILDTTYEYAAWYRSIHLPANQLSNSDNKVFLERNKEANKDRLTKNSVHFIQSNKLEFKALPNTTKFITDSFHQEDVLIAVPKNKKTGEEEIISKAVLQYKRLERFNVWHKKALKNSGVK